MKSQSAAKEPLAKVQIPYYENDFFERALAVANIRVGEAGEGDDPAAASYELIAKLVGVTKKRPDLRGAVIKASPALIAAAEKVQAALVEYRSAAEAAIEIVAAESEIEPNPMRKAPAASPSAVAI